MGNRLPSNIHLHIRADGQDWRCDFQSGSIMQAFEVGREEECCAVEFGKGVRGFDDGVAEAVQNGAVERVEDRVLEDNVLHGVCSAYGSGLASQGGGRERRGTGVRGHEIGCMAVHSISGMESRAASS